MKIFGGDILTNDFDTCVFCQAPTEKTCKLCGQNYCDDCKDIYFVTAHAALDKLFKDKTDKDQLYLVSTSDSSAVIRSWPYFENMDVLELFRRRDELLKSVTRCGLMRHSVVAVAFARNAMLAVADNIEAADQRYAFSEFAARRLLVILQNIHTLDEGSFLPVCVVLVAVCRGLRRGTVSAVVNGLIVTRLGTETRVNAHVESHEYYAREENGFVDIDFYTRQDTTYIVTDLMQISRSVLGKTPKSVQPVERSIFFSRRA